MKLEDPPSPMVYSLIGDDFQFLNHCNLGITPQSFRLPDTSRFYTDRLAV